MISTKNAMLSQSAQDLGMGDMLKAQVEGEVLARKKKLTQAAGLGMSPGMGMAAQSLFGPMGGING